MTVTSDGGLTWNAAEVPQGYGPDSLSSIHCQSPSVCFAFSNNISASDTQGVLIEKTTDAGFTWNSIVPSPSNYLLIEQGSSCPSADFCVLVGNGSTPAVTLSVSGTTSMTRATVPSNIQAMWAVSCPSATTCFAVGTTSTGTPCLLSSIDGGSTWTESALPANIADGGRNAIACPTTTSCVVGGSLSTGDSVLAVTTDGGSTWTEPSWSTPSPSLQVYDGFNRISCMSATTCYANPGGPGLTLETTGNLTSWAPLALPAAVEGTGAITCTSVSDCLLSANEGGATVMLATTDGGSTWTDQPIPAGIGSLDDIACPSPSACYAVGSGEGSTGGEILTFRTGAQVIITSTSLPNAFVGSPYSAALSATFDAAPYTWAITSGTLPTGLTLDASTGVISGTPAAGATTSDFTVHVTGAGGSTAAQDLTLTVG